jgi:hypothetical protein
MSPRWTPDDEHRERRCRMTLTRLLALELGIALLMLVSGWALEIAHMVGRRPPRAGLRDRGLDRRASSEGLATVSPPAMLLFPVYARASEAGASPADAAARAA